MKVDQNNSLGDRALQPARVILVDCYANPGLFSLMRPVSPATGCFAGMAAAS
jgi:hypothetical protein